MEDRIYLSSPHMSEEGYELAFIKEAFDTNWISSVGANIDEFENEIKLRTGVSSAAALANGTSAIHLALKAIGVTAGDVVFCQSLTFSASANPIIYQGATPVFIDSDKATWNMDPIALEEAFQKHPEVKAVIVVHLYGICADMDRIKSICSKYNTPIIEDAAEALGSLYKMQPAGSLGDYGVFSFNGNKIITTSGGGMLVSNHAERIEKVKFWATQSREKARHYQHSELGYNYRMSNILAGIGRGQLKVLNQRIQQKKAIFEFYKKELADLDEITFMPINEWNDPNCWLSVIQLHGRTKPIDVMQALEDENIESRPVWKPMHMQPFFKKYDFYGNGISNTLFENGVCLPSDTKMNLKDLARITRIIKKLFLAL